jgi:hypothetical protein
MTAHKIHRLAGRVVLTLSIFALLTVLSGYLQSPQQDEGISAHIFQLSIVALALTLAVFLVTSDWHAPRQSLRHLTILAVALIVAFGALYYLEHYFYR